MHSFYRQCIKVSSGHCCVGNYIYIKGNYICNTHRQGQPTLNCVKAKDGNAVIKIQYASNAPHFLYFFKQASVASVHYHRFQTDGLSSFCPFCPPHSPTTITNGHPPPHLHCDWGQGDHCSSPLLSSEARPAFSLCTRKM